MPPKPPIPPRPPKSPPGPPSRARTAQQRRQDDAGKQAAGKSAPQTPDATQAGGERIAKVLARAGLASRRDAEAMIAEGRVAINGQLLDSPARNVTPADRITVDGRPLPRPEPARLWLYHKPAGLVTTARDEQGRPTVFEALPEGMPRVMPVGRLDLTSEGLLLLTNDGEVKRKLELPATGWLRKYRVRVHGAPSEAQLAPLKAGIVIEGERFQPMIVGLDRQQGANAWLTIGLREGRNREIRRAMEAVGLVVNRLIRTSYGPFQLGDLPAGQLREVPGRVLRDQLGQPAPDADEPAAAAPARKSWGMKSHGGGARHGARTGAAAEPGGAAGSSAGKPRSWGQKSHGLRPSPDQPQRRTPPPGKPPRR